MGAGGNFRDNAPVGGEDVDLRNHDVAKNFGATSSIAVVADDGGGGFVTRTFDGKYFHILIIS